MNTLRIMRTRVHSALTRVQVLVTHNQCLSRTCSSIGSFLLGFTYCDDREKDSDINIMLVYWLPFLGFDIVTRGKVFLFLNMILKRKNIKTLFNQIAFRFDARKQNFPSNIIPHNSHQNPTLPLVRFFTSFTIITYRLCVMLFVTINIKNILYTLNVMCHHIPQKHT
jgi:hypothetical protein